VSSFPPDTHPATLLRLSASTPVLSDPKLSMCTIQPDAVDARELVCIFSERVAMAWSPSLSERCNQKGQEQACRGEGSDFGGGGDGLCGTARCFVYRVGVTVPVPLGSADGGSGRGQWT